MGTYEWADGSRYQGEWEGGLFHGLGTMIHADGRKECGIWRNDILVQHYEENSYAQHLQVVKQLKSA
jgi:hypothetical protein